MSDQQYRWDGDFDEGNLRSNLGRIFNRLGITDDPYGVADEVVPYFKPAEPCEHGNYARHVDPNMSEDYEWCEGEPT